MVEPAHVRRAAYALVGLALLLAVGFSFMRSETATAPPQPGEAAYRQAAKLVANGPSASSALGDAALAEALRAKLDADHPGARVFAQRGSPGVCFLIGLPDERLAQKERPAFLADAWEFASQVVANGQVVVALQGKLTLAGVARGTAGEACEVVAGLAVVPTELFPFFVSEVAPVDSAH